MAVKPHSWIFNADEISEMTTVASGVLCHEYTTSTPLQPLLSKEPIVRPDLSVSSSRLQNNSLFSLLVPRLRNHSRNIDHIVNLISFPPTTFGFGFILHANLENSNTKYWADVRYRMYMMGIMKKPKLSSA